MFPTSVSAGSLFLHFHAVVSYDTSVLTRRHVPQNRDPTSSTLVSRFPITNTARCDQYLSLSLSSGLISAHVSCVAGHVHADSAVSGFAAGRPGSTANKPVKSMKMVPEGN